MSAKNLDTLANLQAIWLARLLTKLIIEVENLQRYWLQVEITKSAFESPKTPDLILLKTALQSILKMMLWIPREHIIDLYTPHASASLGFGRPDWRMFH